MNEAKFKIKPYGWQELGIMYGPELTPPCAARRLKKWVLGNHEVVKELISRGWKPENRILTPSQVRVIVIFLGEP